MLLDTGSASSWVMGQGCTSQACKTHSTYGKSDSSTFEQQTDTFKIEYSTGKIEGTIVKDTVALAGLKVTMSFGTAMTTSDDFNSYPMDGILGLGRASSAYGMKVPTFMQTVKNNNLLKDYVYGINLQRDADDTNDGEIVFGGFDSTRFQGDLNYLKTLDTDGSWDIKADDILVDGKSVKVTGRTAVFDTGTSYMLIPPNDAKAIFTQVKGSSPSGELWHIPCDTTTSIALVFNGIGYEISPKDYIGPSVGDGMCYSHIVAVSAVDDKTWLLGDTFLKNVYTVYDLDKNRVGKLSLKSV